MKLLNEPPGVCSLRDSVKKEIPVSWISSGGVVVDFSKTKLSPWGEYSHCYAFLVLESITPTFSTLDLNSPLTKRVANDFGANGALGRTLPQGPVWGFAADSFSDTRRPNVGHGQLSAKATRVWKLVTYRSALERNSGSAFLFATCGTNCCIL